ncbi:F-box domain containing protein [Tanacetum coccineum]
MSDMTTLLNDLSYIHPNNEHNEPTQGDIGETSNEPTQATRNEFEELYVSANEELYPSCDYMSSADVARSHGGDGGGKDRPPPPHVPNGCGGCFINRGRITADEWDKCIQFWNDPKNLARAAQNRQNRQNSVVISRQGSRSLGHLRDEMRQSSDTQEYPSLIDTFWRTHTVDGVFPKDEDRRIYEEMKRLEATGEYTEDEINRLARGGKLRGHIPGVGRVLPARATSRPSMPAPDKSLKSIHKKVNFMMSLFRSDSKYSDMFKEFESGGASGSGGCGDDEEGEDEDGDGDS